MVVLHVRPAENQPRRQHAVLPSLSDFGRQRIQLDAAVKREIWKDLFLSLTGYNTFDSRPPNPEANTNDVGVVMSIGWSY